MPSNPSSSLQEAGEHRAAEGRGQRVERGHDDMRRHQRQRTRLEGGDEGHELDPGRSSSRVASIDRQAVVRVDLRRAVAGEVLHAGGDAARLQARHGRRHVAGDELRVAPEGADADDRVPRVRVDVGDRGEVVGDAHLAQRVRRSRPATASVSAGSSTSPSASAPGTELPRAASSRVTSPPSSSIATTVSGATRIDAVSARSCSESRTLRAKRTTPPRPASSSRRSHAGAISPAKPGRMQARASRSSDAAHPFTEPAVRPKAMRRCTSRKKTITGIAVSVEAAISAPQSVLRLVP